MNRDDPGILSWEPGELLKIKIDDQNCLEFPSGKFYEFGTASYWISQYRSRFGQRPLQGQALGQSLLEETAACILGGYGVPAEIGLVAFEKLRDEGLFRDGAIVPVETFQELLSSPLELTYSKSQNPKINAIRKVKYRFPRQRAKRLSDATHFFCKSNSPLPRHPIELRNWLLRIPGVGPKTASWIVRNQTGTDLVAIVDIHLQRAGIKAGFFSKRWSLPRDYHLFEKAFLCFAALGGVPASGLDALIWDEQRMITSRARCGSHLPIQSQDLTWASNL